MVCDEANIETHGFALTSQMSYLTCHPRWKSQFLSRVSTMLHRCKNYSCIITWSLGNESGYGPNHEACASYIRNHDPTRPLQYEGGRKHGDAVFILGTGHGPKTVTDFICPMYHSPAELSLVSLDKEETRPIVLCEYLHAMGNSNGNAHIYWDAFWNFTSNKTKSMQGGYIWDWVDQALVDPHDPTRTMCYGGDFGPTSGVNDAQFCINGVIFANRIPHPSLSELKYLQSPIKITYNTSTTTITIHNRYRFTSLNHLIFRYAITMESLKNGTSTIMKGTLDISNYRHTMDDDLFMPGGSYSGNNTFNRKDIMKLRKKYNNNNNSAFYLTVSVEIKENDTLISLWEPQQNPIIYTERFTLLDDEKEREEEREKIGQKNNDERAHIKEINQKQLIVKGEHYEIIFDKDTGKFVQMNQRDDDTTSIPLMYQCNHSFYRAPTDNDKGGCSSKSIGSCNMNILKAIDKICCTTLTSEGPSATSFNGQWEDIGLDHCTSQPIESINIMKGNVLIQKEQIIGHNPKKPLFIVSIFEVHFLPAVAKPFNFNRFLMFF